VGLLLSAWQFKAKCCALHPIALYRDRAAQPGHDGFYPPEAKTQLFRSQRGPAGIVKLENSIMQLRRDIGTAITTTISTHPVSSSRIVITSLGIAFEAFSGS
jgi:hypothetical protein